MRDSMIKNGKSLQDVERSCKDHAKTLSVTKLWCIKVHEKASLKKD